MGHPTTLCPSPEDLIARARALVPELRKRAQACEDRRSVPPETVADFRAAGFFRLFQPARFGGYEVGLGTLIEIAREVGRGCGSTAWCLALFATHSRLVGLFDERAQQEVFGDSADPLVSAVFAPSATATPVGDGPEAGFRVSGRWRFASGCDYAEWIAVAARLDRAAEGPITDARFFLIPAGEFRIEDTWFAAGLRGTGSKDLVVEDAYAPAYRALSFIDVARGRPPGTAVNTSALFRLPIVPMLAMAMGGPALGLAEAAIDTFRDRMSEGAAAQSRQVASQMRLGEAVASVDAAGLLLRRDVEDLERRSAGGERLGPAQRARYLLDAAFVVMSCTRAVDRLFAVSGASALFDSSPLQRAFRDLHAMSAHTALQFDAAADLFGRIELGLPPGSSLALL